MMASTNCGLILKCGARRWTSLSICGGAFTACVAGMGAGKAASAREKHSGTSAAGHVTDCSMRLASPWPCVEAAKNR